MPKKTPKKTKKTKEENPIKELLGMLSEEIGIDQELMRLGAEKQHDVEMAETDLQCKKTQQSLTHAMVFVGRRKKTKKNKKYMEAFKTALDFFEKYGNSETEYTD